MHRGYGYGHFFVAVCVLCILAVGAFYFFGQRNREMPGETVGAVSGSWELNTNPEDDGGVQDGGAGGASLSSRVVSGATTPDFTAWDVYENFERGFLFRHPSELRVSEFREGGGDIVLAEGARSSFQVFITPWDESAEVITPARIAEDVPDLVVKKPQTIVLAGGGRALLFESETSGVGATREVWIVHGGFLYQISAPLAFDAMLSWVMATWRFE